MSRKYTKIKELEPQILAMRAEGKNISLVQFHDCSVHYPGTWKMCKKCSVYSSNMKAVFHSGAL